MKTQRQLQIKINRGNSNVQKNAGTNQFRRHLKDHHPGLMNQFEEENFGTQKRPSNKQEKMQAILVKPQKYSRSSTATSENNRHIVLMVTGAVLLLFLLSIHNSFDYSTAAILECLSRTGNCSIRKLLHFLQKKLTTT